MYLAVGSWQDRGIVQGNLACCLALVLLDKGSGIPCSQREGLTGRGGRATEYLYSTDPFVDELPTCELQRTFATA